MFNKHVDNLLGGGIWGVFGVGGWHDYSNCHRNRHGMECRWRAGMRRSRGWALVPMATKTEVDRMGTQPKKSGEETI